MKRTNSFVVEWENPEEIRNLAVGCATLWNKLNYKRRQAFFDGEFEFEDFKDEMYDEFKDWVGSATAQQVIRKNDDAWKSFFLLLKKWGNNELDGRPSPLGYWKRDDGSKELRILVRNDCYVIEGDETGEDRMENELGTIVVDGSNVIRSGRRPDLRNLAKLLKKLGK